MRALLLLTSKATMRIATLLLLLLLRAKATLGIRVGIIFEFP